MCSRAAASSSSAQPRYFSPVPIPAASVPPPPFLCLSMSRSEARYRYLAKGVVRARMRVRVRVRAWTRSDVRRSLCRHDDMTRNLSCVLHMDLRRRTVCAGGGRQSERKCAQSLGRRLAAQLPSPRACFPWEVHAVIKASKYKHGTLTLAYHIYLRARCSDKCIAIHTAPLCSPPASYPPLPFASAAPQILTVPHLVRPIEQGIHTRQLPDPAPHLRSPEDLVDLCDASLPVGDGPISPTINSSPLPPTPASKSSACMHSRTRARVRRGHVRVLHNIT